MVRLISATAAEIEDVGSTNGTYVNGAEARIEAKMTVNPQTDRISLVAPSGTAAVFLNWPAILKLLPAIDTRFLDTLPELRTIYEEYKANDYKLDREHSRKTNMVRGGLILVPVVATIIASYNGFSLGIFGMAGGVFSAVGMFLASEISNKPAKDALAEQHQMAYRCKVANCGRRFYESPNVIESQEKCPCGKYFTKE
jgi:hypothetical protein